MESSLQKAIENIEGVGYLDLDIDISEDTICESIECLKKEKNAIILAHYYQRPEIQGIADYVGDSLGLSQKASNTTADIILFAGVHFMAETAKILNPGRKVVLPDTKAGCSLAESCSAKDLEKFKKNYPNHLLITYINASSGVKALSDLVCTSSNAIDIVNSIPQSQPIIFAPDKNLGRYVSEVTGRDMIIWDGACVVHEAFSIDKLLELHKVHPEAQIIAHPESEEHLLKTASYIGSTSGMIKYVKSNSHHSFIVATEAGILHEMKKQVPDKKLVPAPIKENNTCACSECHYMKMNTLKKVYLCLKYELPEITIEESVRVKAVRPIERMLSLSK